MTAARKPSQRTMRTPAVFYWRYCSSGRHLDEAVEELMQCALKQEHRALTPMVKQDIRAEFRAKITSAIKGRLVPVEECKPIRTNPELYEIRWTDVPLPRKDPVSGLYTDPDRAHFRLYYAERDGRDWFLGLHAHEKDIVADDQMATDHRQQAEIDVAVRIYKAPRLWGIPGFCP